MPVKIWNGGIARRAIDFTCKPFVEMSNLESGLRRSLGFSDGRGVMSVVPECVERRKMCRVELSLEAVVQVPGGRLVRCILRNISSMGATVEFGRPTIVPKQFKLIVPEHLFEAYCDVRHKTRTSAGVMFTSNRREASARFASPFKGAGSTASSQLNGANFERVGDGPANG